jgi:hypothetical protein
MWLSIAAAAFGRALAEAWLRRSSARSVIGKGARNGGPADEGGEIVDLKPYPVEGGGYIWRK